MEGSFFLFIGYKTIEVGVTQDNTLQVVLEETGGQLSEVVVTAQGIRRDKKALGYSVSSVDPNTLVQRSEPDIAKGLQGKVAGVDILTISWYARGCYQEPDTGQLFIWPGRRRSPYRSRW